jgi:hypothetical protein
MTCRWDRAAEEYLTDGEPCKVDDYGDPTKHCSARRTCSVHIGRDELTCPRCIGRVRTDLRWIRDLSALLSTAAMSDGVESEAANLAGPAADPEAWSWRKIAARQGVAWHVSLIEDDDERHPYSVTGRWAMMIAEDYSHDLPTLDVTKATDYLARQLGRIAQDDGQDFPLLAREIRRCRQHIESVLHNDSRPERGAPCPECAQAESFVRLVRTFGHYCEDEDCTQQFHYADDTEDRWVCPKDRAHSWTEKDYRSWVEDRKESA